MAVSEWGRAAAFETDAAIQGIEDGDIHMSRLTGMSPADIEHFRIFTIREALLVVVRCPKRQARYHQGRVPAKPLVVKQKSNEDGLVHMPDGSLRVSDYDLMCVYRLAGPGSYEKIFFSGVDPTNPRSALAAEAKDLIRKLNSSVGLQSKIQHGAQDDFNNPKNPGVKPAGGQGRPDRFAAFNLGTVTYLAEPSAAKAYYAKHGLLWPYDASGKHTGGGV